MGGGAPLLIAMLHDQGTKIRDVVEHLRSECRTAVPFNVAFAARCLGEAGDVQDPAHGQALLAELAQAIAEYAPQSKKEEARAFVETALKAFALLAPLVAAPAAVQEAIDRLNGAGGVAPRMAAWQMGFALRPRKERLDYALAALNSKIEKEEAVRRGAIAALEREWPGRADIGPALAEVVRNDPQSRVRQAALAAMQRSWRYEPAILDAIASRVDEETAYTYVVRLIEYLAATWRGNPKARDLVMRLAGPKPKAKPGYDYAGVVKAGGSGARCKPGAAKRPCPRCGTGRRNHGDCRDASSVVLQGIAESWHDDPATLPLLLDRAANDPAAWVRSAALHTIAEAWRGDSQALAFLRDRAANNPEGGIRWAALQAIAEGWRGDAQTLALLRDRATNDPEGGIRWAALGAIRVAWRGDAEIMAWARAQAGLGLSTPRPGVSAGDLLADPPGAGAGAGRGVPDGQRSAARSAGIATTSGRSGACRCPSFTSASTR